jgi:hypothetical protein
MNSAYRSKKKADRKCRKRFGRHKRGKETELEECLLEAEMSFDSQVASDCEGIDLEPSDDDDGDGDGDIDGGDGDDKIYGDESGEDDEDEE